MKEALAFIGAIALAAALWFAKAYSDSQLLASKDATISSLQDTVHTKNDVIAKQNLLVENSNMTIKTLQVTVQSKDDLLSKEQSLLNAKDATISSMKDALQAKDQIIRKDNDLIANYESRLSKPPILVAPVVEPPLVKPDKSVDDNQYVKDSGFDAEDLGSGFSAYQIFGNVRSTMPSAVPAKIPNRTPWKFGEANSGIVANGSPYLVTGASNHDSDGATSSNGQAGLIEYEGSSISQIVDLPAGTYHISFDYEGRRDYMPANRIAVSLGKKVLFTGAPSASERFENVITKTVKFTKSGTHELNFLGLGNSNLSPYPATFIDNVQILPVTASSENVDKDATKKTPTTLQSASSQASSNL